ncbi:DsbA family protein [Sphaerochaeta sp. PS]|uniref:DsbA family protein n=1 Tax=Sphaerochaeta sp. PS TaxID=3076336 RepID=UPI0028A575BA|nr:DsbA family protein [Sphaerochaeta sp. PS]MDT4761085.1 DsbA family protein [Sphaerochaeta sp. PS]
MSDNIVEIVEFTDPVCTWCWGSEPVLRALKARYGNQLEISFVMGGLVEDIRTFEDVDNSIGGGPTEVNKQIAGHWLEASSHHGMPVTTDPLQLFSEEDISSYPQCIAYKAAQFESQTLADIYLRRIREATAVEARQTNRREVLLALAKEVGLDTDRFLTHFNDGSAEAAFQEDLAQTRAYDVQLFPTWLIRYKGKQTLMDNYHSVDDFRSAIEQLSQGEVKETHLEAGEDALMEFIRTYRNVALQEVMLAFELTEQQALNVVKTLETKRLVKVRPAGNGLFIEEQE